MSKSCNKDDKCHHRAMSKALWEDRGGKENLERTGNKQRLNKGVSMEQNRKVGLSQEFGFLGSRTLRK